MVEQGDQVRAGQLFGGGDDGVVVAGDGGGEQGPWVAQLAELGGGGHCHVGAGEDGFELLGVGLGLKGDGAAGHSAPSSSSTIALPMRLAIH